MRKTIGKGPQVQLSGKYVLLSLLFCPALAYLSSSLSALRLVSPIEVLLGLDTLTILLILVSSAGLSFGVFLLVSRGRRYLPPAQHLVLAACLCLAVGWLLDLTVYQSSHYKDLSGSQVLSTADPDTEWSTFRFGVVGQDSDVDGTFPIYFSTALLFDDADEETTEKINSFLSIPDNAYDRELKDAMESFKANLEDDDPDNDTFDELLFDNDIAVVRFDNLQTDILTFYLVPFNLPEGNFLTGWSKEVTQFSFCYFDTDGELVQTLDYAVNKGHEDTRYLDVEIPASVGTLYVCIFGKGAAFSKITLNEPIPLFTELYPILVTALFLFAVFYLAQRDRSLGTCRRGLLVRRGVLFCWVLWPMYLLVYRFVTYMFEPWLVARDWFMHCNLDSFAFLGWVTILGFAYSLWAGPENRRALTQNWRKRPWLLLFGILVPWACICTALSPYGYLELKGTVLWMTGLRTVFFYGSLIGCACLPEEQNCRMKLLRIFALCADFMAVICLLQSFELTFILERFPFKRSAYFYNTNHYGYYIAMTILLCLGFFLYTDNRRWRMVYGASIALQFYSLLVNNTFGDFLAVILALPIVYAFFFLGGGKKEKWLLIPPIVILTETLINYGTSSENFRRLIEDLFNIAADADSEEADHAGSGRFILWKYAVEKIIDRPIFGWGPEGLNYGLPADISQARPHNELLGYAAFFGLPGLGMYLSGLITLAVARWKELKTLSVPVKIAAGAVVGYLISSLFGCNMFYSAPFFFLLLGIVAGGDDTPQASAMSVPPSEEQQIISSQYLRCIVEDS